MTPHAGDETTNQKGVLTNCASDDVVGVTAKSIQDAKMPQHFFESSQFALPTFDHQSLLRQLT